MADDEGSAPLHHACEVIENARLGVRIDRAQGVVEDENPRVGRHRTRQRGTLLLPP